MTFQRLDDTHTRVSLAMDFEPQDMAEKAGDMLGVLDRRVKGDLRRFKGFIEERGQESGGWRGRISPRTRLAPTCPGGPAAPPRAACAAGELYGAPGRPGISPRRAAGAARLRAEFTTCRRGRAVGRCESEALGVPDEPPPSGIAAPEL